MNYPFDFFSRITQQYSHRCELLIMRNIVKYAQSLTNQRTPQPISARLNQLAHASTNQRTPQPISACHNQSAHASTNQRTPQPISARISIIA